MQYPLRRRKNLHANGCLNLNECKLLKFQLTKKSAKFVYKSVFSRNVFKPKALVKWKNSFLGNALKWRFIFTSRFVVVRDIKIQNFQFRHLHRIIGINKFLFHIKIKDSPFCSFLK